MGQLYHDTTYTKIFVGNLAWKTTAEDLRFIFQQFGPIIHANIVYERLSGRSKGYGFVTFVDADSAGRAYDYPFPIIIEGRRINFNLASFPEDPNLVNHGWEEPMNYPNYPFVPNVTYIVPDQYGNQYYPPYYGFAIPHAPYPMFNY